MLFKIKKFYPKSRTFIFLFLSDEPQPDEGNQSIDNQ